MPLGATTSPPALSSSGDVAVYSRDLGNDRWDIFAYDLSTGTETRITSPANLSEPHPAFPRFAPDDLHLVLSIDDSCFGGTCRALATMDLLGSSGPQKISSTFTVKVGKGRDSRNVEIGTLAAAIWRR